jgi:hypothetical protein
MFGDFEIEIALVLGAFSFWWLMIYDRDPRRVFTFQDSIIYLKQMLQSALKSFPIFWAIAFLLAYVIVGA